MTAVVNMLFSFHRSVAHISFFQSFSCNTMIRLPVVLVLFSIISSVVHGDKAADAKAAEDKALKAKFDAWDARSKVVDQKTCVKPDLPDATLDKLRMCEPLASIVVSFFLV